VLNIVVLFFVCMMSLQAPVKRAEERFALDEGVWIFGPSGALSTGRTRDISLSGAAVQADIDRALAAKVGDRVRVFITEVGFVNARVVRQSGRLLAIHFDLPPSVERDLLISKLFTLGLDTTAVHATAGMVTVAMLRSILAARTETAKAPEPMDAVTPVPAPRKSPAASLVVRPTPPARRLIDIAAERRSYAA
jgi:cellulose synthase (UDP-forming)